MQKNASDDFDHVLRASEILAESLPGHVFIGGVAVYLHSVNSDDATYAEASHDSDVVVSFDDIAYLRDAVEVVTNRRLRKSQALVEGVEVDVYVEHNNDLVVPYEELYAHAQTYGSLRIACPEHLLALKLTACADRGGSAKGDKDERDVVRLSRLGKRWHRDLVSPYVDDDQIKVLKKVARSHVFSELCERNEHEAKKLRGAFEVFLRKHF